MPKEWYDALLIPVPKKWDLTKCDNWRGISLLDIIGKLFGKVLQRGFKNWLRSYCLIHSVVFIVAGDVWI